MNMLKWSFVSPELKLMLCVTKSVLSTSKSGGKLKSQSKGKLEQTESQSWNSKNICRNRTWDKHLLTGERTQRKKTKETEGGMFFMREPAELPARAKRKNEQLFWLKLTNGAYFPIPCDLVPCSPEFYCLAVTWAKQKKSFRTCGLTSSSEVEASPANLLACNFKCIQRSSVCETWLCTLAVRRETCQAQWRDGVLFDLSPHQPFLSRRTFMRGDVLKGQLKELFLKIISCLKISGAFITACFKSSF